MFSLHNGDTDSSRSRRRQHSPQEGSPQLQYASTATQGVEGISAVATAAIAAGSFIYMFGKSAFLQKATVIAAAAGLAYLCIDYFIGSEDEDGTHRASSAPKETAGTSEDDRKLFSYVLEEEHLRSLERSSVYHNNNSVHGGRHKCCAICLDEYLLYDIVKPLPCFHLFHKKCIEDWLGVSQSCPTCKEEVPSNLL